MTAIYVQDVTLRDGVHAIGHRCALPRVRAIVTSLDNAGVAAIEIAHGDGLDGSSANYGIGAQWITAAAREETGVTQ